MSSEKDEWADSILQSLNSSLRTVRMEDALKKAEELIVPQKAEAVPTQCASMGGGCGCDCGGGDAALAKTFVSAGMNSINNDPMTPDWAKEGLAQLMSAPEGERDGVLQRLILHAESIQRAQGKTVYDAGRNTAREYADFRKSQPEEAGFVLEMMQASYKALAEKAIRLVPEVTGEFIRGWNAEGANCGPGFPLL